MNASINWQLSPEDQHLSTEVLSLALDGFLDNQEGLHFAEHLAECQRCRLQWRKWQHLDHLLEVAPFAGPAPGFLLRVDERIRADQRRRERLLGGAVLVGGTLSVWGILVMGLVLTTVTWLVVSPEARFQMLELVGFGGQLIALALHNLSSIRDGVLDLVPGPGVVLLFTLTGLAALAAWLALVLYGGRRDVGLGSNGTERSANPSAGH